MALIDKDKDPMGQALSAYFRKEKVGRLLVRSSMFDEDEMPVDLLFRPWEKMSRLEQAALSSAKGKVLDVGAGSGCHALELQRRGFSVTAIDISPGAVDVMRRRGVKDARLCDFFDRAGVGTYDTVLMLMNGSGIVGKLEGMPAFFDRLDEILLPGGQVLMDSSDLRYIYEDEDGVLDWDPEWGYYGEVDYRMQYGAVRGEPFDWLYVDPKTLVQCASAKGYRVEMLCLGENYSYLARITKAVQAGRM